MGTVPLLGSVVITLGGAAWYFGYARRRIDREGAAVDAVRREVGRRTVARTRDAVTPVEGYEAMVAVPETTDPAHERSLIAVAADLARAQGGSVTVVRFDEVADQVPLPAATDPSKADLAFEERIEALEADLAVPIRAHEAVSHDTRHAVANAVTDRDPKMLVLGYQSRGLRDRVFDSDADWVLAHTDCEAVVVDDPENGVANIETVTVITDEGPYDPAKVAVADAVAVAHGATVCFEYAVDDRTSEPHQRVIADYHEAIAEVCSAPVRTGFVKSDGGTPSATGVFVVAAGNRLLVADADEPVLVVRPQGANTAGRMRRVFERWLL